jgi:hypothetical protein
VTTPQPSPTTETSQATSKVESPPPASNAWAPLEAPSAAGAWDAPPSAPALEKLPIEATLRTAMDDIGTGFWRLLAVGAIGFTPIWAAVVALGDSALGSLAQFLTVIPSAALLAAAGAVRADRRPGMADSYRQGLARLLHYVLASVLVAVIAIVIMLGPMLIAAIAIAIMLIRGTSDATATVAVVLVMVALVLLPLAGVTARLSLVGPLVVVEGLSVGQAVPEGWRRTRGQVLRLLTVFIVGSLPGMLVALGAALLAFGLLAEPVAIGLVFGLGYTVAIISVTCIDVVAWQRLGGVSAKSLDGRGSADVGATIESIPAGTPRASDRGPLTAILLLVAGLSLLIGGSAAAAGKVGGWVAELAGQPDGAITYGVGGVGCYQLDERTVFEAGDVIHLVADLTMPIPAGQRLGYEVYADGELIDRGFEEPFGEATECVYYDLDTTDIEPAAYTFRYLWAADVVAEGTFTITP